MGLLCSQKCPGIRLVSPLSDCFRVSRDLTSLLSYLVGRVGQTEAYWETAEVEIPMRRLFGLTKVSATPHRLSDTKVERLADDTSAFDSQIIKPEKDGSFQRWQLIRVLERPMG